MNTSIENDLDELLSCAICLGTLSEPKLLPCSHRFCKPCIIMEMDRSASPKGSRMHFPCPLCKREIKLGKGRNGEEWIVNFETDRLLKDIQDLLNHEKEDAREICLSHRTKLSLVCYSCGTIGCYVCAWQDHRSCHDVKNFQIEARRIKLDLQKHLDEIEICINKIVPYVARWSSFRKSLKNQWNYSDRFIEERLKHLQKESVLAVEDLVQDYECFITRSCMSKEIEKEIRRLMETFTEIIDGKVDIVNIQSRLQRQNETIIFPQIQDASVRLERVQDVQLLISTVGDIKQVLDLGIKDFVLRGRDILTQKSTILSKAYREKLTEKVDTTSPKVVQDSLVTKPEHIDLGKAKYVHLLRDLKTALRNSQTPKELIESTGLLCFPGGYQPQFVIDPANDPILSKRRQTKKSKRRQPKFQILPKENFMRTQQSHGSAYKAK